MKNTNFTGSAYNTVLYRYNTVTYRYYYWALNPYCELSTQGPLEESTAALRVEVATQLRANPTLHMDGILNALHLNKAIVDPADFQTDEGFPDVTAVVQCFTSMAADPHTTLTLGMETIQAVAAAHSARDEIFTPEGP